MANIKAVALGVVLAFSTVIAVLPAPASAAATGWSAPERISPGDGQYQAVGAVSVATGPDGTALAAWTDYYGPHAARVVYYRWYTVSEGWSENKILYNYAGAALDEPQVAASANGDFMLVYTDRWYPSVQVHIFDASAGTFFPTSSPVEASVIDIQDPQVAMDANGNAVVLWAENDGVEINITANRYVDGSGWEGAEVLDTETGSVQFPELVMDTDGDSVATWRQTDGSDYQMFASNRTAEGKWSAAVVIDELTDDVYNAALAIDSLGRTMAVWAQSNGTTLNVYSSLRGKGGTWQAVEQVSGPPGIGVGRIAVAGGYGGHFVVAYAQYNGVEYQMMAALYVVSWGPSFNLSAEWAEGGGTSPMVAIDGQGIPVVVWSQYGGGHPTGQWVSWGIASGWSTPERLDNAVGTDTLLLGFGFSPDGWGLAFWSENDGWNDYVWTSIYQTPDTTPPPVSITSPVNGALYEDPVAWLYGDTSGPEVQVFVNGNAVAVDDLGEFVASVPLSRGNNTITVTVVDKAGNEATDTRYVTYVDPVPALQAEIAEAQAEAAEAHAVAHALGTELSATQNNLTLARNRLSSVEGDLVTLQNTTQMSATAQTAATTAAANAAASAGLLGLLGLLVGVVGAAMALLSMRNPKGSMVQPAPPIGSPPSTPPIAQPVQPAEPPK